MKILWINMSVPPEADSQLGGEKVLKKTGGWVLGLAHYLIQNPDVELAIGAPSPLVSTMQVIQGEKIKYYVIPQSNGSHRGDKIECDCWREVKADYCPDVVHIHGTEHHSALTWLKANGGDSTVASLQGIISVIAKYYYHGMSSCDVIRNITLRDFYRGTIFQEAKDYVKRGKDELESMKILRHVIGRTQWDKTQTWGINPEIQYHFCNEILREEFYRGERWKYCDSVPHSIFISQSIVPYKGLHQVIKAMPAVLREFPDATIRVAGYDMMKTTFKEKLKRTGYAKYIMSLISRYGLEGKVTFTGRLSAEEMKREYLSANVFISPSSIENSPNSLCEAQILGVPCVASRVGGVETLIPEDCCGLMFEYFDTAGLANAICTTFRNSATFDNSKEIEIARQRHAPAVNCATLMNIYSKLKD